MTTQNPLTTQYGVGAIEWRSLLPRAAVPELFHASFIGAGLPGRDEIVNGRWCLFDEENRVVFEVLEPHGVLPAHPPEVVSRLFAFAFEMYPEAFGRSGGP